MVHSSHGIGIFDGIHKLDMHGVVGDYIKLRYAKSDTLYVPVTQLDMVSKYIGPREDSGVKLNRLGGSEWQKAKSRVRAAVRDMAKELIKLYAERMQAKGHAFSEDSEWQHDFESHFEYDETEDQLRCVEEIKSDMEREAPMDRLLCGDVGFGKTEVALRAAFKCVCDSKQCALLVPTTILAWQHFQTICKRLEGISRAHRAALPFPHAQAAGGNPPPAQTRRNRYCRGHPPSGEQRCQIPRPGSCHH